MTLEELSTQTFLCTMSSPLRVIDISCSSWNLQVKLSPMKKERKRNPVNWNPKFLFFLN
jgi:hypothetical protein